VPPEGPAGWKVDEGRQRKGAKEGGARLKEKYAERLAACYFRRGLFSQVKLKLANSRGDRRLLHLAMELAMALARPVRCSERNSFT